MSTDLYICSTFRNDWNRSFNLALEAEMITVGFRCYLPQRDSEQLGNRKATFLADKGGIDAAKLIIAVGSQTQTANWGFEVGYAFALKKPVIILTDKEHPAELMPEGAVDKILVVDNLDDFSSYAPELAEEVRRLI